MRDFLTELWLYARERKKFWMLPIIVLMILLGILIISVQSAAVSPFIYSIF